MGVRTSLQTMVCSRPSLIPHLPDRELSPSTAGPKKKELTTERSTPETISPFPSSHPHLVPPSLSLTAPPPPLPPQLLPRSHPRPGLRRSGSIPTWDAT